MFNQTFSSFHHTIFSDALELLLQQAALALTLYHFIVMAMVSIVDLGTVALTSIHSYYREAATRFGRL